MEVDINEISWPAKLNLEALNVLDEQTFINLIISHIDEPRKDRTITLPARAILKKCLAHYFGSRVADGSTSWDEVKKSLKKEHGSLRKIKLDTWELRQLYHKRQKEILNEKLKEKIK